MKITALIPYLHVADSISVALHRDFVYPALVSSTVKRRIQKSLDNNYGLSFIQKTPGQRAYIGIVMSPCKPSNLFIPAYGSPDLLMLVARHGDPVSRSAYSNAIFVLALLYGNGQRMCIVRIIYAVLGKTTKVLNFVPVSYTHLTLPTNREV